MWQNAIGSGREVWPNAVRFGIMKYKLEKVVIEETEDGILIRSAVQFTSFQKAIEKLRKNKAADYKRIESQASDPETIKYYAQRANNFSDVDLGILEE